MGKSANIKRIIKEFVSFANKFDVDSAIELFAKDAVIDDESVGTKFSNIAGVRNYLDRFFVGYKTVTKIISLKILSESSAIAKVDFTGDFGHETGALTFTVNSKSQITKIDAYLDRPA
ncbi:MAG: hypothetical protein K0Q95_2596 [Bacteroidota bacterium]|jgi:hypothetical protein|nr:hypothetical protein [Bacteroidota bacterium]